MRFAHHSYILPEELCSCLLKLSLSPKIPPQAIFSTVSEITLGNVMHNVNKDKGIDPPPKKKDVEQM